MRLLLVTICVLGLAAVSFLAIRYCQCSRLFPKASEETVQLTPENRDLLQRLRAEKKFEPHNYPPLGYTGTESIEERALATSAVHKVIDSVLSRPNGPVHDLSALIGKAMREVDWLPTEDRERTGNYLLEIWYILGFKGATGRFAYGSAFRKPPGYGEPLPPGWLAPDQPRPIN